MASNLTLQPNSDGLKQMPQAKVQETSNSHNGPNPSRDRSSSPGTLFCIEFVIEFGLSGLCQRAPTNISQPSLLVIPTQKALFACLRDPRASLSAKQSNKILAGKNLFKNTLSFFGALFT